MTRDVKSVILREHSGGLIDLWEEAVFVVSLLLHAKRGDGVHELGSVLFETLEALCPFQGLLSVAEAETTFLVKITWNGRSSFSSFIEHPRLAETKNLAHCNS